MSKNALIVIHERVGYHVLMSQEPSLTRAERNRLQLRSDIVAAAFVEFSERGYHQTAIADIARRLGIGHGTFYRYFENKRDILEHVIDNTQQRLMALLSGENAPSAVTTLAAYQVQCRRIGERLIEFACGNPGALRLLLLEATSIDAEMTQRIFGMMEAGAAMTAAYLSNGVAHGFLRRDLDCEATARAIVGMIMAGSMCFLSQPDQVDMLARYADAIVDLLVNGMAVVAAP